VSRVGQPVGWAIVFGLTVFAPVRGDDAGLPDERAIRETVQKAYDPFARGDPEGHLAVWSDRSPHRDARKALLTEMVRHGKRLAPWADGLKVVKTETGPERPKVLITLTNSFGSRDFPSRRANYAVAVRLVREAGQWRVWSWQEPLVDFVDEWLSLPTAAERERLLDRNDDLDLPSVLAYAVGRSYEAEQRGDLAAAKVVMQRAGELVPRVRRPSLHAWYEALAARLDNPRPPLDAVKAYRQWLGQVEDAPRLVDYLRLLYARALVAAGEYREAHAQFEAFEENIQASELYHFSRNDWLPGLPAHVNSLLAERGRLEKAVGEQWGSNDKRAAELALKMLAVEKAIYGPEAIPIAGTYRQLAEIHVLLGDYAQAEKYLAANLDLRQKFLGPDHWRTTDAGVRLRRVRRVAGWTPGQKHLAAEANQALGRAMALLKESTRGEKSRAALALQQKSLDLFKELDGERNDDYVRVLVRMAKTQQWDDRHAEAAGLIERAAELHLSYRKFDDPKVQDTLKELEDVLYNWVTADRDAGRFDRAIRTAKTRVRWTETRAGSADHHDVYSARWDLDHVVKLSQLSPADLTRVREATELILRTTRAKPGDPDYGQRIQLAERASQTCTAVLGERDRLTLTAWVSVSAYRSKESDYLRTKEADDYQARIIRWYVEQGADEVGHPDLASQLVTRSYMSANTGLISDALAETERAYRLYARSEGPTSEGALKAGLQYVRITQGMGQYEKCFDQLQGLVAQHRRRALGEAAIGYPHELLPPDVDLKDVPKEKAFLLAQTYDRLQSYYERIGNNELGLSTARIAWQLFHHARGPGALFTVQSSVTIGVSLRRAGRLEEAQNVLAEVVRQTREQPGENTFEHARALHDLSDILMARGRYAEAEAMAREAYGIVRRLYPDDHRLVIALDRNLADACLHAGKKDEGIRRLDGCMKRSWDRFEQSLPALSEAMIRDYIAADKRDYWRLLTASRDGTPEQLRRAFQWYLLREGLAFDTLCRLRDLSARVTSPQLRRLLDEARAAREQVEALVRDPSLRDARAVQAQIRALETRAQQRELELHRELARVDGGALNSAGVTVEHFAGSLPPRSVFVGYLWFRPYRFGVGPEPEGWSSGRDPRLEAPRFFAFVLPAGEPDQLRLVDLGPAEPILDLIEPVRDALNKYTQVPGSEKGKDRAFRRAAKELHGRIWGPLGERVREAEQVLVSARDELQTIPLAALVDDADRFLIERHRISYVLCGRDLLRPTPPGRTSGVQVFADPDYDLGEEALAAAVRKLGAAGDGAAAVRGPSPGAVRGLRWQPLPATRAEAEAIVRVLPRAVYGDSQVYTGPDALHERLLQVRRPRILHLATHGFYLPPEDAAAHEKIRGPARSVMGRLEAQANPFYRSGIVLAGCNSYEKGGRKPGARSGWVTAEELAGLDLRGTELVVLSACQTGRGDIAGEEGIIGPPRALLYAGARSVITTLFAVPDQESQQLMAGFYQRLATGLSKQESLRRAQLDLIDTRRKAGGSDHPFYWSAFTLCGEP
jgi:CHAT domain-containing protein/tetratricopeptide (TPR) repeat protein